MVTFAHPGILHQALSNLPINPFGTSNLRIYKGRYIELRPDLDSKGDNQQVLVPNITIDVYERGAQNPGKGKYLLNGVTKVTSYQLPCLEITLAEYTETKKNYLTQLETDLALSLVDHAIYVNGLFSDLAYMSDMDNITGYLDAVTGDYSEIPFFEVPGYRNAFHKSIQQVIDIINEYNITAPRPNRISTQGLFTQLEENTLPQFEKDKIISTLQQYLYNQTKKIFLDPVVNKAYPDPIVRQHILYTDDNSIALVPSCEEYKGTCCLFDEQIDQTYPGLNKKFRIFKECLLNVDQSICFNNTKAFTNLVGIRGSYDNALFYNDEDKKAKGCDMCNKDGVHAVYCSSGGVEISKNITQADIEILVADTTAINLQFFLTNAAAEAEYQRRLIGNLCWEPLEIPPETTPTTEPTTVPTEPTPYL